MNAEQKHQVFVKDLRRSNDDRESSGDAHAAEDMFNNPEAGREENQSQASFRKRHKTGAEEDGT